MPRGGYRPGSGPPKGTKYKKRVTKSPKKEPKKKTKKATQELSDTHNIPEKIQDAEQFILDGQKTPLEYMLSVINDAKADPDRRDRMAQVAAAYVHPRLAEQRGKKEDKKDRAKAAGNGKYAPSKPPKLKAVK